MGWPEALVDMVKIWTNTQQKVWTGWLNTMQGIGRAPTSDLRGQILDTWQESINHTLEAQSEWMRSWVDGLKDVESTPEAVRDWVDQSQEALVRWNEAQQQLWERLFDVLRQAEPGATAFSLESKGMEVFNAWQQSVQALLDTPAKKPDEQLEKPK